jgi:DNA-binding MarR family transcriptional regulator
MSIGVEREGLTPERETAWLGILRAHTEVTRALDGALASRHGLSLSAYEVLSRLAAAEHGSQRMSDLAGCSPLSLSRVSRVIDALQERGLVSRSPCGKDSRVVYAAVTPEGAALAEAARETFAEIVAGRYLGRLSCDEVGVLGELLGRLTAEPGCGD